jgi:DNA invertase Pin-like site-specific DNA recombinase
MKNVDKIIAKMVKEIPTTDCIAVDLFGATDIKEILERTINTLNKVNNDTLEFPSQRDKRKAITVLSNFIKKYGVYGIELYGEDWLKEYSEDSYNMVVDNIVKKAKKVVAEAPAPEAVEVAEEPATDKPRVIGYARVSTREQNLDRQIKALKEYGCDTILEEKKTGKNMDRLQLQTLLNTVKAGDTVVVSELTRISRSTADLHNLVNELDAKGVTFKSLKESWIDTTTAHGRLVFTMLAGVAQFERELMLERQAEGIEVAKERGVKFGRKLDKDANLARAVELYKEGKYPAGEIAKMCKMSRATLYRRLKDLGLV